MKNTTSLYILGIFASDPGPVMKVVGISFGSGLLLIGVAGVAMYHMRHITVSERKMKDMENHTSKS